MALQSFHVHHFYDIIVNWVNHVISNSIAQLRTITSELPGLPAEFERSRRLYRLIASFADFALDTKSLEKALVSNHSTKAAIPCPHTEHLKGFSQFFYIAGVILRRRSARGTAPVNPSASSAQTMTGPLSLLQMKATQKQKRDRRVQAIKEGKVSKEYHIPKRATESKSDAPKVGPVASSTTKSKKKSPTVI